MSDEKPQMSGPEVVFENYQGSDGIKVNAVELRKDVFTTEHPSSGMRSFLFLVFIIILSIVSIVVFMKLGMELLNDETGGILSNIIAITAAIVFIIFVGMKVYPLSVPKFKSFLITFNESEIEIWTVREDRVIDECRRFSKDNLDYNFSEGSVQFSKKDDSTSKFSLANTFFKGDTEYKDLVLNKGLEKLPIYLWFKKYKFEIKDEELVFTSSLEGLEGVQFQGSHIAWPIEKVEAMDPRAVKMVQDAISKG